MQDPQATLISALGEERAALLRPHLEEVAFADGEALLAEGVAAPHLFVIVAGEVSVRLHAGGSDVEVARRGVGDWLGEIGLVDRGPAMATVVASGPVQALRMGHDTLMRLQTEEPRAASAVLRHVTRQLAERIALGSAGIVEEVGPGRHRLRKPEEVRGWAARVFGWLLGGEAK